MALFNVNWPINPTTVNTGPIQFKRDGSDTDVSEDTATPGNSRPMPVKLLDSAGADGFTETNSRLGATNESAAATDTSTSGLNGLVKRLLQRITTLLSTVSTAANQATANSSLSSIDTKLSSQATAANQATEIASLSSIDTKLSSQATAAKQDAEAVLVGAVNETAPASDTASSGLNGRLQRIAQRLTSLIALFPSSLGQKTSANSLAVVLPSDQTVPILQSGKTALATARIDYSSVSVTTGAYTQLVSNVGGTAVSEVEIFDSSGQTLVLAVGAVANETDKVYIFPGGNGRIPLSIAASARVSVKAVSAAATTGEITVNFYG